MRCWLLAGVAVLAACKAERAPAPDGAATDAAVVATSGAAAPTASDAMLDRTVSPRQPGKYAPRDECGSLPGARAFRLALAGAVARRDADAVAAMALEDVRLGFGGEDGRARLLQRLRADGKLFDQLAKILPLGCAATDGGGLTLPWFFAQDFGDTDATMAMLVAGAGVPVLDSPSAGGKEKARIDWDVVELVGGLQPAQPFQHVRLADRTTGYIVTDNLRSLLDYRLLAINQNGTWKIAALLAGD